VTFVQGNLAPTDEWKQIKTREKAECLAAAACQKPKKPRQVPRKNKIPDAKTRLAPDAQSLPLRSIPGRENATPVPDAQTLPLSISREGSPQIVENVAACPANISQGSAVCGFKPQSWQRLSDVIPLPKQSSLQKG
jgi:hypothetical protein